jgi:diadenosine tetraphosphate (Ap4A) HIT family hydrolase
VPLLGCLDRAQADGESVQPKFDVLGDAFGWSAEGLREALPPAGCQSGCLTRAESRPSRSLIEAMVGHPGGVGLSEGCLICQGLDGDRELGRVLAWEDDLWRVTISLTAPVVGFAYLEPKRHIPHITDLDGVEATTLGPILARITRILEEETGAELIYVNVFGERVPHLHFNLAPHRTGDPLAGGAGMIIGEPPPQPEHTLRKIANQLARRLRD